MDNETTTTTQNFAFPPERQAQIEALTKARQAQSAPFQRQDPRQQQQAAQQANQRMNTVLDGQGAHLQQGHQHPYIPQQSPQQAHVHQSPVARPGITMPVSKEFPSVPNVMPGFTAPVADPEGVSLGLPSKFAFYNFKDVYVKPFKGKHLSKLSRAHAEGSLQQLVEVVSSVLSTTTPGVGPLGFELTLPDFTFVLYWLRQNSYTKSSFIHKTQCNNPAHIAQVREGLLAPETLQIAEIIRKGQLTVVDLDDLPDPEYFKFPADVPFYFTPATMRTAIEFAESPKMQAEDHEEFEYLAQLGSFIQHVGFLSDPQGYWTVDQRAHAMEEAEGSEIQLIKEFEEALQGYGVEEKINVTCKVCGASRMTKVVLDAHSFLSIN
jgi:hypothetical protein